MGIPFWPDLALVLLGLEAFLLLLIPGVALFLGIRGMRWLLVNGRSFLRDAQDWTARVEQGTKRACGRILEPVIRTRVLRAQVKGLWQGLIGIEPGGE